MPVRMCVQDVQTNFSTATILVFEYSTPIELIGGTTSTFTLRDPQVETTITKDKHGNYHMLFVPYQSWELNLIFFEINHGN
jgi:hypothetical protein